MNCQSVVFLILAALVATSNCNNFGVVGEKNLITTILNLVLKQVLPALTDVNIPSLSLGPNTGRLVYIGRIELSGW